jgi:hypothetical protein
MVSIPRKEGVFATQTVYLEDRLLGIVHNLSQSNYTFTSNTMVTENRFYLQFSTASPTSRILNTENQISIYSKNGVVVVASNQENIANVTVTDIYNVKNGAKNIATIDNLNTKTIEIPVDENSKLLNVKVTLKNGTVVNKKIFR